MIKKRINIYYYIPFIFYLIPIIFFIGSTSIIINNNSINRINLILNYQLILIIASGLAGLIHAVIKDINK